MTFARTLRILWAAICMGGGLALAVFGGLVTTGGGGSLADHAEGAFYVAAFVALGGLLGAFALLRLMESRLLRAGSEAEAESLVQSYGLAALAVLDGVAVASGVAAFLTGDLLPLAFGAPLFAFAWLTWPSDERVARWRALRQR